MPQVYLDEQGNEITGPVYLNDQGEPVAQTADPMKALSGARGISSDTWTDRAVNALPNIGGMVGSLIGGVGGTAFGMGFGGAPGAIGGATLGGGAGAAARQLLNRARGAQGADRAAPSSPAGAMADIGAAGAVQGGVEGVGRGIIGPGMRTLGRQIYVGALKPSNAIKAEFARPGAPNSGGREVAKTLIAEGVPITRSGAGTEKMVRKLAEAGDNTSRTLAAAEAAGAKPVSMRPVAKALDRTRSGVAKLAIRKDKIAEVDNLRDQLLAENQRPVPLTQAQSMKQAEQGVAVKAYQKQARGMPTEVSDTRLSVHEDVARGLKESIERRVPEIRDMNQRTQQLIGGTRAVSGAEGRIANNNLIGMGDALSLGSGALGYGAMGAPGAALGALQMILTRPEIASRAAMGLDRAPVLGHAARPIDAIAGSPIEQFLREALIQQLSQP